MTMHQMHSAGRNRISKTVITIDRLLPIPNIYFKPGG